MKSTSCLATPFFCFHGRLLQGLWETLKQGIWSRVPPSGQFYKLRLLFILTALRPELRLQLQQVGQTLHDAAMLTDSRLTRQSAGLEFPVSVKSSQMWDFHNRSSASVRYFTNCLLNMSSTLTQVSSCCGGRGLRGVACGIMAVNS